MNDCKYSAYEFPQGLEHAFCKNEVLKELNKSNGTDIPCMGSECGQFESKDGDSHKEAEQ